MRSQAQSTEVSPPCALQTCVILLAGWFLGETLGTKQIGGALVAMSAMVAYTHYTLRESDEVLPLHKGGRNPRTGALATSGSNANLAFII